VLVLLCVPLSAIFTMMLGFVFWIPTPGMLVFLQFARRGGPEATVLDLSNYPALALAGAANLLCVYAMLWILTALVRHVRERWVASESVKR